MSAHHHRNIHLVTHNMTYLTEAFLSEQGNDVMRVKRELSNAKMWLKGACLYESAAYYGYMARYEPDLLEMVYPSGKPDGVPASSSAREAREIAKQSVLARQSMERQVERASEALVSLYNEQKRFIPAHILAQLWADGEPRQIIIDSMEENTAHLFGEEAYHAAVEASHALSSEAQEHDDPI